MSSDLANPILVADIGGTNARFALATADGRVGEATRYPGADHPDFVALLRTFIASGDRCPVGAVLAIAAPITGGTVKLTNSPWTISAPDIRDALSLARVVLINDFAAQALALPALAPADLTPIGGGRSVDGAAMAVLGPGTGLGVAGLIPYGDGYFPVAGEGGHVTFAPTDAVQAAVVDRLVARFGHVSAERILSGPGLVNVYGALAALEGGEAADISPAEVVARAKSGRDRHCVAAIALFCSALGSMAGDLALTFGARGGVYIGGGVSTHFGPLFDAAAVRRAFENKGRFQSYLSEIPLFRITMTDPALIGAARAYASPGTGSYVVD